MCSINNKQSRAPRWLGCAMVAVRVLQGSVLPVWMQRRPTGPLQRHAIVLYRIVSCYTQIRQCIRYKGQNQPYPRTLPTGPLQRHAVLRGAPGGYMQRQPAGAGAVQTREVEAPVPPGHLLQLSDVLARHACSGPHSCTSSLTSTGVWYLHPCSAVLCTCTALISRRSQRGYLALRLLLWPRWLLLARAPLTHAWQRA
jgi:hypothetical protein